jgi:hypothetical protein
MPGAGTTTSTLRAARVAVGVQPRRRDDGDRPLLAPFDPFAVEGAAGCDLVMAFGLSQQVEIAQQNRPESRRRPVADLEDRLGERQGNGLGPVVRGEQAKVVLALRVHQRAGQVVRAQPGDTPERGVCGDVGHALVHELVDVGVRHLGTWRTHLPQPDGSVRVAGGRGRRAPLCTPRG